MAGQIKTRSGFHSPNCIFDNTNVVGRARQKLYYFGKFRLRMPQIKRYS